ncbi:MAG TPA: hypothetical protein VIM09_03625, partial [Chthoniobacterales bacterium]
SQTLRCGYGSPFIPEEQHDRSDEQCDTKKRTHKRVPDAPEDRLIGYFRDYVRHGQRHNRGNQKQKGESKGSGMAEMCDDPLMS